MTKTKIFTYDCFNESIKIYVITTFQLTRVRAKRRRDGHEDSIAQLPRLDEGHGQEVAALVAQADGEDKEVHNRRGPGCPLPSGAVVPGQPMDPERLPPRRPFRVPPHLCPQRDQGTSAVVRGTPQRGGGGRRARHQRPRHVAEVHGEGVGEAPEGGGEAAVPDGRGLQPFPGGGSGEARQGGRGHRRRHVQAQLHWVARKPGSLRRLRPFRGFLRDNQRRVHDVRPPAARG